MLDKRRDSQMRDGQSWFVGRQEDVEWITAGVKPSLAITAAIPSVFEAYATLTFPNNSKDNVLVRRKADNQFDDSLLEVLKAQSGEQPWWLGFLKTGASDIVFTDADPVNLYGWSYVLIEAGPRQARQWRDNSERWFTALPELMFPADRSWLLSSLWDDAWASIGGKESLVNAIADAPSLGDQLARTDPTIIDMVPPHLDESVLRSLGRPSPFQS